MTDSYTMGRRSAEFILSEAAGSRSRETGIVAQGETLVAGQLLMASGDNLVAHDGDLDSNGAVVAAVAGVLLAGIDTDTTGLNAAAEVAYIARDAEVNDNMIVYPTESSEGGEKAACVASMKSLGIIARPEIIP